VRMPELDGIEAVTRCFMERPVAIIVISAHLDPHMINRATHDHVMAYLLKPIKATGLEPAISIAMQRFCEFQALDQDVTGLK
jgi:AmiR/NasT family two-component response regulator